MDSAPLKSIFLVTIYNVCLYNNILIFIKKKWGYSYTLLVSIPLQTWDSFPGLVMGKLVFTYHDHEVSGLLLIGPLCSLVIVNLSYEILNVGLYFRFLILVNLSSILKIYIALSVASLEFVILIVDCKIKW